MNDSSEQVMKEWRLRQPSPELRRRIFAPEPAGAAVMAEGQFDFTLLLRWLVPAVGCFAMVMLTHSEATAPAAMEPLGGEQQLAFSTATRHTSMNNVPTTTVEWTFGRASSSNNDSYVRMVTNELIGW